MTTAEGDATTTAEGDAETTATETYINTPTESRGRRRTTFAYRDVGSGGELPLVLIHHFRGNLENWDPPPVDALE